MNEPTAEENVALAVRVTRRIMGARAFDALPRWQRDIDVQRTLIYIETIESERAAVAELEAKIARALDESAGEYVPEELMSWREYCEWSATALAKVRAALAGGRRMNPEPPQTYVDFIANEVGMSHVFDGVNAGQAAELICEWTRARVGELETLLARGKANGVLGFMDDHQVCDQQLRAAEARIEAVRALVESMYEGRHPSYSAAPDTPDLRWFGELRAALAAVPPETPKETT